MFEQASQCTSLQPPPFSRASLRNLQIPIHLVQVSGLHTGCLRHKRYTTASFGVENRAAGEHVLPHHSRPCECGTAEKQSESESFGSPHGSPGRPLVSGLSFGLGPFKINIKIHGIHLGIHGIYCRILFPITSTSARGPLIVS
jgi:hypothetical protein